jgi:glucuronate isomerase
MQQELREKIFQGLMETPVMDAHTHVDSSHMTARGLHDILLYHMIISELYSAGCPDGARLSEDPDEEEVAFRIERALPYLKYIQNTSCFWGATLILKNLYGWTEPITVKNWREIHEIIKQKAQDKNWYKEVMKKGAIERLNTEYWRRRGGRADNVLQYALEWAFFARCQWNQYDTALIELENTWDKDEPSSPLPVTMPEDFKAKKPISTLDDVHQALKHYCDLIPFKDIVCICQSLSTEFTYKNVSEQEMASALLKRATAGPEERDIYASYIFERFLLEIEKRNHKTIVNLALAAEPLPFESGSRLRVDTIYDMARIAQEHPDINFHVFLASTSHNQAVCTLVREIPNIYLIGYWWHSFFPSHIGRLIEERLDMVPMNKQLGFFSDAYCLDWAYGKSIIVRTQLSEVLSKKIMEGQYTYEQAMSIAKNILYETAKNSLGLRPAD